MNKLFCLALCGSLAVLALSSSCQSSGHQQADSTGMQMDSLRAAVVSLKEEVNAVATSLATVVEKADVDPSAAFKEYSANTAGLKTRLEKAEANLKSMKAQGEAYFTEWEKQAATMEDADLKAKAVERREKLSKAIGKVSEAMREANLELQPFAKTSADVQTYLKNDLTPDGIKSVKDKSKQLGKDAKSIGDKLDDVVEALEEGAPEFKTAKPPPPPAKT